jgi:hypothetical protein
MVVLFIAWMFWSEFKVVDPNPEGKALQQLKDKVSTKKYRTVEELMHFIATAYILWSLKVSNLLGGSKRKRCLSHHSFRILEPLKILVETIRKHIVPRMTQPVRQIK